MCCRCAECEPGSHWHFPPTAQARRNLIGEGIAQERIFLVAEFLALLLLLPIAAAGQAPVIVDTDAGADDLIALLWLMRQPAIRIEAVTITQGLAHPAEGAESVLRLLEAGGLTAIPVYVGGDRPVQGTGSFPAAWRTAMAP